MCQGRWTECNNAPYFVHHHCLWPLAIRCRCAGERREQHMRISRRVQQGICFVTTSNPLKQHSSSGVAWASKLSLLRRPTDERALLHAWLMSFLWGSRCKTIKQRSNFSAEETSHFSPFEAYGRSSSRGGGRGSEGVRGRASFLHRSLSIFCISLWVLFLSGVSFIRSIMRV